MFYACDLTVLRERIELDLEQTSDGARCDAHLLDLMYIVTQ